MEWLLWPQPRRDARNPPNGGACCQNLSTRGDLNCDGIREPFRGGVPGERLAGSAVELVGDGGEVVTGVHGQVGTFGEVQHMSVATTP